MPRMSAKKAKKALEFCTRRDGLLCIDCGKRPARELHHLDDNYENNPADGSNWIGLCHSCHRKMHPRGPNRPKPETNDGMKLIENERESKRERDSESEQIRPQTIEMMRNSICQPKFTEWLASIIAEVSTISVADVKNGGAYYAGCSQQAIARYLDQLCSFIGPYEYFTNEEGKRFVRLRQVKEKTTILPIYSAAKGA